MHPLKILAGIGIRKGWPQRRDYYIEHHHGHTQQLVGNIIACDILGRGDIGNKQVGTLIDHYHLYVYQEELVAQTENTGQEFPPYTPP